jgi:hypothetical protein
MSARDVGISELFDELGTATLRAVEAEQKVLRAMDLARKWAGIHTVAGIFPEAVPWAEGVDSAYHTAADELSQALEIEL